MLGRIDAAESDYRDSLAAFRALGELWGVASVLIQLADLAQLKGDYATVIAALEEAGSCGRELGWWGDLNYIDGMLAAVRLRTGDLDRARQDLERAERSASERTVKSDDMEAWLGLTRAELNWREGDLASAARNCANALARVEARQSEWWDGMRVQLRARLAMVVLQDGDEARCRELLAAALGTAADWVERHMLAIVIDAIAVFVLQTGEPDALPERATAAATLLGIGHAIRGAFDEGSLDAPGARDAARAVLGEPGFDDAYERGRALGQDEALALAEGAISGAEGAISGAEGAIGGLAAQVLRR
jgi:tetratricopeptide (TPR) repeat protein